MATFKAATKGLFKRVYNNEMIDANEKKDIMGDEAEIKAICQEVFGDGSVTPSPETLFNFNQLIVETANEVYKPKSTSLIDLLANKKTVAPTAQPMFELPRKIRSKVIWSATGSGVEMVRVEGKSKIIPIRDNFSAGFSYSPLDLVEDSVNAFRDLVNDVVYAKERLYMEKITAIVDANIASGKIPAANILSGSNTAIADYNKLASKASRYGGRPVLIADTVMIDDLAMKQNSDTNLSNAISDNYKDELLLALNVTRLGRTTAFNLVNSFVDDANTITELDIQKGYIIAGEAGKNPFEVIEYGGLKQTSETNFEDGIVKVKVFQQAAIAMLYTSNFFYVKDTALAL